MVRLLFSVYISCAVEYIVYMYLSVLPSSTSSVTAIVKLNRLGRRPQVGKPFVSDRTFLCDIRALLHKNRLIRDEILHS
jgi:hypothetical protein